MLKQCIKYFYVNVTTPNKHYVCNFTGLLTSQLKFRYA